MAKILAREKDADSQKEIVGGARGSDNSPSTLPSTIKGDTARCSISVPSQISEFRAPDGQDMLGAADSDESGGKQEEDTEVDSASPTSAPTEVGYVTREIGQDKLVISSTVIDEGKRISPHPADDNDDMAEEHVKGSRKGPKKDS